MTDTNKPMHITNVGVRMLHALKTGPKTAQEIGELIHCSNGTPQQIYAKVQKYNLVTAKKQKHINKQGFSSLQWIYSLKPGAEKKLPPLAPETEQSDNETRADVAPELLRLEKRANQLLDEINRLKPIIPPKRYRGILTQLVKHGIRLK